MLEGVISLLKENAIFAENCNPALKLWVLNDVVALLHDDNNIFVHVKIEIEHKIINGRNGLLHGAKIRAFDVPKIIHYGVVKGYNVLVTEGIFNIVLNANNFNKYHKIINQGVRNYVEECKIVSSVDSGLNISNNRILEEVYKSVEDSVDPKRMIVTARELVTFLRGYPQHGDFSINNFGISNKRLVVFDWEDFDKIDCDGFDLAVFFASISEFNKDKLYYLLFSKKSRFKSISDAFLKKHGMDNSDLWNLLPVYYALFLYLKKKGEYSNSIVNSSSRLINDLLRD